MIQTHCISKRFNLAQNPPLAPETVYDKGMKNETTMTAKQAQALAKARVERDTVKAILETNYDNVIVQAYGGFVLRCYNAVIARKERKYGLN